MKLPDSFWNVLSHNYVSLLVFLETSAYDGYKKKDSG